MSGFENEYTVIATLLNDNWTDTAIAAPGTNPTMPTKTGKASTAVGFLEWRLENVFAEKRTPSWIQYDNAIELIYYEEAAGQGDTVIRQRMDTLLAIFRDAHTSTIYFDEGFLEPAGIEYGEEWYVAQVRVPFSRFSDVSSTEVLVLAGQGANQLVISETAHGFAVKDWVGQVSGTWSKAIADGVGPLSSGVVSTVIDADNFVLTTIGALLLEAHGWSAGELYLDQSTAGAATSTAPTSGVSQQVSTVDSVDQIIVTQYVAQTL